jgi:hypothetical protein
MTVGRRRNPAEIVERPGAGDVPAALIVTHFSYGISYPAQSIAKRAKTGPLASTIGRARRNTMAVQWE